MAGGPREYDREYLRPLPGTIRVRVGVSDQGTVTRFLVQLEYWFDEGWHEVVRYDHDADAPEEMAHDVTEGGLHVDIYRDGEKHSTEFIAGSLPPDVALDLAVDHLAKNLERFVRRFEEWHGIKNGIR